MLKSDQIMNNFSIIKMIIITKYTNRRHINDHINLNFFNF